MIFLVVLFLDFFWYFSDKIYENFKFYILMNRMWKIGNQFGYHCASGLVLKMLQLKNLLPLFCLRNGNFRG